MIVDVRPARPRGARRAALTVLGALGAGLGTAGAMAYADQPDLIGGKNAEIQGTFSMSGLITDAINLRGEKVGEKVTRVWAVTAQHCNGESICRQLVVVRDRGSGLHSAVVLKRFSAGDYGGSGAFWVALRCLRRTYPHGSRAPYRITLQVTKRVLVNQTWYATRVYATYFNPTRTDRTPCPLGPASDAAHYYGSLVSALPTTTTTATTPATATTTTTQTLTTETTSAATGRT